VTWPTWLVLLVACGPGLAACAFLGWKLNGWVWDRLDRWLRRRLGIDDEAAP
jgi:hypothetical protein